MLAGVVPEGHADTPRKQRLNDDKGLPFQGNGRAATGHWERQRNGGGMEWRGSWGREARRGEANAADRPEQAGWRTGRGGHGPRRARPNGDILGLGAKFQKGL